MKYVRAEGEGVSKKWPIFVYDNTDRLREKRTGGGERVQNPKNFAYVLNGWPLLLFCLAGDRNLIIVSFYQFLLSFSIFKHYPDPPLSWKS